MERFTEKGSEPATHQQTDADKGVYMGGIPTTS